MAKKENQKEVAQEIVQETRSEEIDNTVENTLISLYRLQQIDSQIDRIRIIRGELPLEVKDLEDEIEGLETRIKNYEDELKEKEKSISDYKNLTKDAKSKLKKYEEQQKNVRNNREFTNLEEQIEYQSLVIQECDIKSKKSKGDIDIIKKDITSAKALLKEVVSELEIKKSELDDIVKETEEKEIGFLEKSKEYEEYIDERYLKAYHRIRNSCRNGLAVVTVERDACGGCFNKIPHQRQLDIKMHKKIIVCEYCGRILVDQTIAAEVGEENL